MPSARWYYCVHEGVNLIPIQSMNDAWCKILHCFLSPCYQEIMTPLLHEIGRLVYSLNSEGLGRVSGTVDGATAYN